MRANPKKQIPNPKQTTKNKNQLYFFSFVFCLGFAICLLGFANSAFAHDYPGQGPFPIRNQNPIYLQNLSLTPTRAEVLPEGSFEFRIDTAYSNLYERGANARADLDLDMEYMRLAPQFLFGLSDDMQLGLEVPLIHFNGGFLDGFIQKYHRAFGFPNGGREFVENGRFSYLFKAGGATLMNFPSAGIGLGDVILHFKHQLRGDDREGPAISWFTDFKFPTGSMSRGIGSGSPDFGVGFAAETSWRWLHGYFNAEYIAVGGNELIDLYMNGQMLAYMIAGEVTFTPGFSLIAQLNGSTPLLANTGIQEWDGIPLDLIIGFRGEQQKLLGGQDFIWQIGFSEDVTGVGPSVDFTVFVSLGLRFDLFGRSRPAGDWLVLR